LDEQSEPGSEQQSDYDVEEEYDNDYAENYFDNGEGDDLDELGGGGEDYGGGEFSIFEL
jgi:DNA-directed RNA polymerase III subunit RPC7